MTTDIATREAAAILDVERVRELLRPLSDDKRRFLRLRALTGTDADAARLAGLKPEAAKHWRRKDPAFLAAYEALLLEPVVHAMAEMQMLAPKAVNVVAEQLDSPHGPTKQKAAEMVLKSKGIGLLSNYQLEVQDESGNSFMRMMQAALDARNKRHVEPPDAPVQDEQPQAEIIEGEVLHRDS